MSYKELRIWALAREIVIEVHEITLTKLPKFEMYEVGSQIRRSTKTTRSAIVEGYGRRRYKQDWIKFLTYSLSSNDESLDHLETLWETKSLVDETLFINLKTKIEVLGKSISNFIKSVDTQHRSVK